MRLGWATCTRMAAQVTGRGIFTAPCGTILLEEFLRCAIFVLLGTVVSSVGP